MKILQVNNCDLPGRIFNGYDLSDALQKSGIDARQMVFEQTGKGMISFPACTERQQVIRTELIKLQKRLGMSNLLESFSYSIFNNKYFIEADVVHYHLVHNHLMSVFDFPRVINIKPSVWTIHDPWVVTGNCIYPLECSKWRYGCNSCKRSDELPFSMDIDKVSEIWKIKKDIFKDISTDVIVSTKWMEDFIKSSPLTRHLTNIHRIPFGVDISKYVVKDKKECKNKWGIPKDDIVIGFRAEENPVKGLKYIIEALEALEHNSQITILTNGTAQLPKCIKNKFCVIELGWQNSEAVLDFFAATDIFLMPSLAESFGLMGIEAMASECAVVVFQDTVLEQITFSPECGIAVPLKDSNALWQAMDYLITHKEERIERGKRGREIVKEQYQFSEYVKRHIEVYKDLLERTSSKESIGRIRGMNTKLKNTDSKLDKIRQFQKEIKALSNNQAEKICIFCMGNYGKALYEDLRKRLIRVDYFIDNDSDKQGMHVLEIEPGVPFIDYGWENLDSIIDKEKNFRPKIAAIWNCQSMKVLLEEKENTLIIVSKKNPEGLMEQLSEQGFPYIVSYQEIRDLMKEVPELEEFPTVNGDLEIKDVDYSSAGVQQLIDNFNWTIAGICQYYEDRLWQFKDGGG